VEPSIVAPQPCPPADRVLLDYHNPQQTAAPNPAVQALCVAACVGVGTLLLIVACVFAVASARVWGEWGRVTAGALCTLLSAAGVFASFVAARHHWRIDQSRRSPSG
jgi:hypothetical protein